MKAIVLATQFVVAGSLAAQRSLPIVRLGAPTSQMGGSLGSNDQTLLAGLIGATRLPNGTIVIGDGAAPRILVFSTEGRILQTLGRLGDGPGELRMPRWVGACGPDAFAAYDAAQLRLTLFSQNGALRKTISVPASAGFDQVIACRDETLLFLMSQPAPFDIEGGSHLTVNAALARVTTNKIDTLATIPRAQEYYVNRARTGFSDVPLGRLVYAAAGPSLTFVCSNQEARCTVYDTVGRQRGSFVIALKRQRLSAGDWEHARLRRVEAEPRPTTQKRLTEVLKELPEPSAFPLIDQLRADSRDRLWVRTFPRIRNRGCHLVHPAS